MSRMKINPDWAIAVADVKTAVRRDLDGPATVYVSPKTIAAWATGGCYDPTNPPPPGPMFPVTSMDVMGMDVRAHPRVPDDEAWYEEKSKGFRAYAPKPAGK